VGKKSLAQLKKLPGLERAHLEVRRGTAQQAREYCIKSEGRVDQMRPVEWGEMKQQGNGVSERNFHRQPGVTESRARASERQRAI